MLKLIAVPKLVCALLIYGSAISVTSADITEEVANDITISDAAIVPLGGGGARLKFVVANDGTAAQYLTGVGVEGASDARLVFYSSHGAQQPIVRLAVLPDEEVDFSSSHMQAIVSGLPSIQSDGVSFDLLFESGTANSTAHQH